MRFIILLLLFSSCYTKKQCERFFPEIKDSTHYSETIIIRDSIIKLPGATVYDTIKSPCDEKGNLKPFKIKKQSGHATIQAESKGNYILLTGSCDSLEAIARLQDRVISMYRSQVIKESAEKNLTWAERNIYEPLKGIFKILIYVLAFVGFVSLLRFWK